MKHLFLSGSYSTGKSTVHAEVQKKYKEHYYTPDLAREYLERNDLHSQTMKEKDRKEMQLWVAASYIGNMKQSESAKMINISDSSLLEVYAYSETVLSPTVLAGIAKQIELHKDSILALVFLPTIPLEDDGLRHTDKAFRLEIHRRIMQVIQSFHLRYHYIVGRTVPERVQEVEHYIKKETLE